MHSVSHYHNLSGHIEYTAMTIIGQQSVTETTKNKLLEELVRCEPYFINLLDAQMHNLGIIN